jgi:RecB family exonuclease
MKGKIDRIDEIRPGVLWVTDYKTGRAKSENALR